MRRRMTLKRNFTMLGLALLGLGLFSAWQKTSSASTLPVSPATEQASASQQFAQQFLARGEQPAFALMQSSAGCGASFAQPAGSPVGVGSAPTSITVGDFNLDGKPDLAAGNETDNNVTILLGNGAGGFTQPTGSPISVGSWPRSTATEDFNLDGKPDLVTANRLSDNVTILLGDGLGGFTQPAGPPSNVGDGPYSVTVGDFNLDGKPDLATANAIDDNVTILLGDGSGGFTQAAGSPIGVVDSPYSVTAGDFNLDGKPDLVTANFHSHKVTILLGDGSGGFTQAAGSPVSVGNLPNFVTVGDFNLDGKPDLATANIQFNNVTILLGDGSGGFAQPPGSPVGAGEQPYALSVADFNLDGKPDLGTVNRRSDNMTILLGNGIGGFAQAAGSPVSVGTEPFSLTVGDFNLDGKPDLATANVGSGNVTIRLNTCDAYPCASFAFKQPTGSPIGVEGTGPFFVAVGDFNLDGKPDLATANMNSNNVTILLGNGMNGFTESTIGAGLLPNSIAVGDFNLDGKPDLAVTNLASGNVTIMLGNGLGGFTSSAVNVVSGPRSVAVGDFNLDGKPDLVVANDFSNAVTILRGDGMGGFTPANLILVVEPLSVAVRDFNLDGKPDVAVAKRISGTVTIMLGDGQENFTLSEVGPVHGSRFVTVGDFNLDGKPDLATANTSADNLTILLGNGTGGFTTSEIGVGNLPHSIAVGDFNRDGKPDLATANHGSGNSTILLGDGMGGFTASTISADNAPFSVAVGDFNLDGSPDLALANAGSNNVTIQLTGCNTPPTMNAAPALTRQQGSPAVNSEIATVSDGESPAGNLTVTAMTVPAGLVVSNIVNNNGAITADVRAECEATIGSNTVVLEVSDGELTNTANLTVNVTANTSPVIGYPGPQTVVYGQSLIITPTAGPSDNGSLTITAQNNLANFSGSVDFNNVTGVFTITNASPPGSYGLGVRAEDNCGSGAGVNFSLTVNKANTTTTVASSLNPSVFGQEVTFTASVAPVAPGAGLPAGTIVFSIDGAPQTPVSLSGGQASFVASALTVGNRVITASYSGDANFNGSNSSLTQTVICATVTFMPTTLPHAQVNTTYPHTITALPAEGNYSFAVTSGLLPTGLALNGNGTFGGAPTQSGTFNFRVTATGESGCNGFRDYVLLVNCPGITVNPATLANGAIGESYSQTVSAAPSGAYSFGVSSGALPPGLMLNAATGTLTGTPAVSGTFSFRITAAASASDGCAGSRDYTVSISCPAISLASLANATAGVNYSSSAAASPAGSHTYSLSAGNLPAGLTLHPTIGTVTGLTAVTGNYNFTVKAQTPDGCSGTQSYSLTVACPAVTLASLPAPAINTAYNQKLTASPAGGSYSFAVTAGTLPAGLSLNLATGVISGTPATAGSFNFTITASGFSGGFGGCTGSRAYSFTIGSGGCPTITLADLPNGQLGQLYNASASASPAGSYSYAVTAGSLPPGLTLYGSLGMLFGYPTTAGTFNFTITATNAGNCTGSKIYSVQIGGAALRSLVFGDFDGDGKADLSVWRGASGEWLTVNSSDGASQIQTWGTSRAPYFDAMTPGDYDGDGKMDAAVFRRWTGEWLIKRSSDGAVTAKVWGVGTDVPVPGDYDGDGQTDFAVWRGEQGHWYILRSSDNQTETVFWGTSNAPYRDLPVAADYDGDGRTDIAVFRQMTGHWYIRQSSDGQVVTKHWGLGTDVPVAADYDGDGKADIAVWRGAETNWHIARSSDGMTQSISWGTSTLGDVPALGDYDGDGKADVAVWRAPEGVWYVQCSREQGGITKAQGRSGDIPVNRR